MRKLLLAATLIAAPAVALGSGANGKRNATMRDFRQTETFPRRNDG